MGAQRPGDEEDCDIKPHTGLPMNVGKYGNSHGGSDDKPAIGDFHNESQGTHVETQGGIGEHAQSVWQAIKTNTP